MLSFSVMFNVLVSSMSYNFFFFFSLDYNDILIASQSCLYAISSDLFKSSIPSLIPHIKSLVYHLSLENRNVRFLWVPSHVGVAGNNKLLASFSRFYTSFCPLKIPASNLLPIHRETPYAPPSNPNGPLYCPTTLPGINSPCN